MPGRFSYNRNGNITALSRYDGNGIGTALSFSFTGNRIAADGIEFTVSRKIPLWAFGFLY